MFTLLWRFDVIDFIVDEELKVLIQQRVDQRGVGYTLSICQEKTRDQSKAAFKKLRIYYKPQESADSCSCRSKERLLRGKKRVFPVKGMQGPPLSCITDRRAELS